MLEILFYLGVSIVSIVVAVKLAKHSATTGQPDC